MAGAAGVPAAGRRRGRDRLRAEGAGPDHGLPFADRVIVTLVILRLQLPHAALAVFYGVHRSTITRAVGEIRPLLAARGFAVPGEPGLRLRTLADVFAYAAAQGVKLRIDGTEVQVRAPRADRPGRRAFVSGKKKQNTIKSTAVSDEAGAARCGRARSGPAACTTAPRCAPRASKTCSRRYPDVNAEVDAGLPGPGPRLPRPGQRPAEETRARSAARGNHAAGNSRSTSSPPGGSASSTPSPNPSNGGSLQRYPGRREYFDETALAIAGLVSDRAADAVITRRPARQASTPGR